MAHEHLYKWSCIHEDSKAIDESAYLDWEMAFKAVNIRTRVKPLLPTGYSLWVPLKDELVAKACMSGSVKEVITETAEAYHVFHHDLSYKNKKLHQERYRLSPAFSKVRQYLFLGLIIIALLLVFRFVKFS